MSEARRHIPVLLREVLEALQPRDGGIYVDGTFGAGGYAAACSTRRAAACWGIDRDPEAIARGAALADRYDGRLALIEGRFGEMRPAARARHRGGATASPLDLGVSSMQIDEPSAASPSASTVRSTCAWSAPARSAPT